MALKKRRTSGDIQGWRRINKRMN
ncbi:unnamed protein product [Spirodela intermedia]|uniref:Uncharacterized protein n=2 Tax=Spirodela intermedia TaxID=51605 RepID=A0A7I8L1Y7_SPIIN|nr:unnamed protein product [Spirodela intermedia]CAA6666432.1 unnamed protein product [Spirodela intermedia]CAA7403224.1 unnamed protein product [Spirodela intermedia]